MKFLLNINKEIKIYDSARRGHPSLKEVRELLAYHHLILQLERRFVLIRYKRSVLGIAWTLLNSLGMMIVLTIDISQLTTAAMVNRIWGSGLLNHIYIQRASFAIAALGTSLVNLIVALLALVMLATSVRSRLQSWSCLRLPDWKEALRLAMGSR